MADERADTVTIRFKVTEVAPRVTSMSFGDVSTFRWEADTGNGTVACGGFASADEAVRSLYAFTAAIRSGDMEMGR